MALTQISTAGVKDDAVTAGKIPANAVGSSELADNAVDTAAIAADAVTTAKIAAGNITATELGSDSVTGAKIAAGAINNANKLQDSIITGAKIGSGTITDGNLATNSVTTGKIANDAVTVDKVADDAIGVAQLSASGTASSSTFLRGDNSWTTVNTDLVSDTSPQLGGDLQTNGNHIGFGDNEKARFGAGNDLDIYHNGGNSLITNITGHLLIGGDRIKLTNPSAGHTYLDATLSSSVDLYHNNSKKFETKSWGCEVTGQLHATGSVKVEDNAEIQIGTGADLKLYHDGTTNIIEGLDGNMSIRPKTGENGILLRNNGAVELYHDDAEKMQTTSYGIKVHGYTSQSTYVGFHVMGTNQDHGYGTNHGSGITTYNVDYYSPIPMWSNKTIDHGSSYLSFPSYASGNYLKFTAPVAGLYQLELIASVESHHGGDWCQMGWEVNTTTNNNSSNFMNNNRGVMAVNQRAGDDTEMGCHFSTTIWLDTNDYAVLYQQSTAAVRWRGNQYYARGHLIS